ncbi:MAG TPA: prenyltransferase/squalene oxidase repeat-containing protein [Acidobacteriaceae bacterium]|nr:prenyltransferase/squalene oxidase repeat-containing protein [Acidobacteriaceae bacterium]
MHSHRKKNLERALSLSVDYILSRQHSDGSWVDWELPPGQSSTWTTAYVGGKLTSLASHHRHRASSATASASQWLTGKIFPDCGWGYNEQVDSDADSTALAILFLASEGKAVSDSSYSCLEGFQCEDGGFATFRHRPELGSWATSHSDVTPSAVLALTTKYATTSHAVNRGLQFVLDHRTSTGIWQPFWWTSFLYSTERSLSLFEAVRLDIDLQVTRNTLLHTRPKNSFESALLLSSLLWLPDIAKDQDVWPLADHLVEDQAPDGSWSSRPMLRVTRRDCLEPWKPGDPDPLFRDQNRLFTTATVMDAFSNLYKLA